MAQVLTWGVRMQPGLSVRRGIRAGCWSPIEHNEQRKRSIKGKEEGELCGIRQERLLRKVKCECADIERTPNRLLEVTKVTGWVAKVGAARRDLVVNVVCKTYTYRVIQKSRRFFRHR
ncbi:hypothetical protein ALC62_08242 [Cyphomyrmex costatus]|uniref:Uncharacterized protein n=1 Tax=Cyphomyrmex costatus TaxID=456900 RepID=A0A195CJW2_9HYME|nr:hypothetical protein ALC62_08242 [Cyphomyrmex costatus]